MKKSKNTVTFPVATMTTTGSTTTTVEGPATSRILRVSVSLTTLSALWIAHHVVRRVTNRRTSSTRYFTTKDVKSTPRATTRCGSARSCANPSSRHLQLLQRKNKTKTMKTTRKTVMVSNSSKTSSTSYLEEILAFASELRSSYSERSSQSNQQFRGHSNIARSPLPSLGRTSGPASLNLENSSRPSLLEYSSTAEVGST